jgi:hypothetical protein
MFCYGFDAILNGMEKNRNKQHNQKKFFAFIYTRILWCDGEKFSFYFLSTNSRHNDLAKSWPFSQNDVASAIREQNKAKRLLSIYFIFFFPIRKANILTISSRWSCFSQHFCAQSSGRFRIFLMAEKWLDWCALLQIRHYSTQRSIIFFGCETFSVVMKILILAVDWSSTKSLLPLNR